MTSPKILGSHVGSRGAVSKGTTSQARVSYETGRVWTHSGGQWSFLEMCVRDRVWVTLGGGAVYRHGCSDGFGLVLRLVDGGTRFWGACCRAAL